MENGHGSLKSECFLVVDGCLRIFCYVRRQSFTTKMLLFISRAISYFTFHSEKTTSGRDEQVQKVD
jgi:hypothetical protein